MPHYDIYNPGWDLAYNVTRYSRDRGHPAQLIVNEGNLVLDDRTFRRSNTVLYNGPGSTIRLRPTRHVSSYDWYCYARPARSYPCCSGYYSGYCRCYTSRARLEPRRDHCDYSPRALPPLPRRDRIGGR
ncbi:hypothetical protein F4809DRAFT_635281 [Biscogniauxia mediterranea]|nr:hypothetical protein F4809DRAFT_635281 [Biscogniauxia mediterranea]